MKCSFFYKKEKVECITYKFSYAIWTNNRCVYKSKWKKPFISIKNKTKKNKNELFSSHSNGTHKLEWNTQIVVQNKQNKK